MEKENPGLTNHNGTDRAGHPTWSTKTATMKKIRMVEFRDENGKYTIWEVPADSTFHLKHDTTGIDVHLDGKGSCGAYLNAREIIIGPIEEVPT